MPSPKLSKATPPTNRYALFLVKALLVLLILLLLPKLVKADTKKRRKLLERKMKAQRLLCQREECYHLIPEESMACITACVSPACHRDIYEEHPLEPGELDFQRLEKFEACLKDEMKEQRRLNRRRTTTADTLL
mmetsp:Transcript_9478/g.14571  ORF Transcript_9478/g.14571 Transcript_9478/m.14571 type:complete len:134 (-) Transcript_9478:148-549(-)